MANENTRFYKTAIDAQADNAHVTVATGDATANSALVEVTFTKASFEGGSGRNDLLRAIDSIKVAILEADWPAI